MHKLETSISTWASQNIVWAWLIISILHFFRLSATILVGILFYVNDFITPYWIPFICCQIFFINYFFFPEKHHQSGIYKYSPRRAKIQRWIFMTSGILAVAFSTAHLGSSTYLDDQQTMMIVEKHKGKNNITGVKKIKKEFKATKKRVRAKLKEWKKAWKNTEQGDNKIISFLLIFSVILIILALSAGILSLSCTLSCSDAPALAVVVLIAGFAGLIWLGIFLFRSVREWFQYLNNKDGSPQKVNKERLRNIMIVSLSIIIITITTIISQAFQNLPITLEMPVLSIILAILAVAVIAWLIFKLIKIIRRWYKSLKKKQNGRKEKIG